MWTPILLAALLPLASRETPAAGAPWGAYVEARTASVWAGACHYGAQYTTQGREALVGWRFEGGAWAGVELAGVALACLVAGDRNLDEEGVRAASVVLLDAAASQEARAASLDWLRATQAGWIGELRAVRVVPLTVLAEGERYLLSAGERVRLAGTLLPERECCAMPYDRWYAPLASVQGAIVGCSREFAVAEPALTLPWKRGGENDAFVARFGPSPSLPTAR